MKQLSILVTAILFLSTPGCDKIAESKKAPSSGPAARPAQPTPDVSVPPETAISGQLTISAGDISTTTVRVEGYPELTATVSSTGTFLLPVPESTFRGLWLSDNTLSLNIYAVNGAGAAAYGMQALDVAVAKDKATDLGSTALEKSGGIQGTVTLSAGTDFTGIEVYVPGTIFAARTDSAGNFLLSGLPPGTWPLRIEADGFRPVDTKRLNVTSNANTQLDSLILFPSTGVHATLELAQGSTKVKSRSVPVQLHYSPNATLMRWSEDPAFTNVPWTPITRVQGHSFTYQFANPGRKTLFAALQDAEGTETTISAVIDVELFSDDEGFVSINGNASGSREREVSLAINLPENAVQMQFCENQSFTGCSWQNAAATATYTFQADGSHLYAKYKDSDGFESELLDVPFTVDTVAPALTVTSHGDGERVITSTLTLTGSCETGLAITVTLGAGLTGASTAGCASGAFSLPLTLSGTGEKSLQLAQTDAVGNATQLTLRLNRTEISRVSSVAGSLWDYAESGNTMVTTHSHHGFAIWDTTTPTSPVAWVSAGVQFTNVVISNDTLYVGHISPSHGIKVYDISARANPTLIRTLTLSGQLNDLILHESHLYAATNGGIQVWDLSSSTTNPTERTAHTVSSVNFSTLLPSPNKIATVSSDYKIRIFDLTDVDSTGMTATVIDQTPSSRYFKLNLASMVQGKIYAPYSSSAGTSNVGIRYFDLETPGNGTDLLNVPACVSNMWSPLLASSRYLVPACTMEAQTRLFDIQTSADGSTYSDVNNNGIFIVGWISAHELGKYSIAATESAQRKIVIGNGTIGTEAFPMSLEMLKSAAGHGNRMAIQRSYSSAAVADLTTPSSPIVASLDNNARVLQWSGDNILKFAFGTLRILTPGSGLSYSEAGTLGSLPDQVLGVGSTWAFTGGQNAGALINISNPSSPSLVATQNRSNTSSTPTAVHVAERMIYEGTGNGSLFIWEVSAGLTSLAERARLPVCNNATGIAAFENYVYVACEASGVSIVNVSNKAAPVLVGNISPINAASNKAVKVLGKYLYVTDSAVGFRVYSLQGSPEAPIAVAASPVPIATDWSSDIGVWDDKLALTTSLGLTLFAGLPGL